MKPSPVSGPCPCGSGKRYAVCCGPLHSGARPARTAEQLMRSRYSAYVLGLEAYLLDTWHPDTRPSALGLAHDRARWLGLSVHEAVGGPGDELGRVRFSAFYRLGGAEHRLNEHSTFVRTDGRWTYLSGEPD